MTLNIGEIITRYLKDHGYDGLYSPDAECACKSDDLCPCGIEANVFRCRPGYLQPCDCGEHDWHIGAEKTEEEE